MNKTLAAVVLVAVASAACAAGPRTSVQTWSSIAEFEGFSEEKLIYAKELRCYKYAGEVLVTETGAKIRFREEAIERVRMVGEIDKESVGESIFKYGTLAYAIPVGFVWAGAGAVLMVPAYPYMIYGSHQLAEQTFHSYDHGTILLAQGKFAEARRSFFTLLEASPGLVQDSDLYYKIAETYEGEHNRELADHYYGLFLNYAVSLYPDYFVKYDKKYRNSLEELDREFTKAEEKLAASSAAKQAPS